MSFDKMILNLTNRMRDSISHVQNLERRLKELESQDNPLAIIEPGLEDLILSTVIPIKKVVSVLKDQPDKNFFDSSGGLSLFFAKSDEEVQETWALFKFPSEISRPPDIISLPRAGWICSSVNLFQLNWEIHLIKDIFNIKTVTWNSAQSLNTLLYSKVICAGNEETSHPTGITQRLCVDISQGIKNQVGPYYGFLLRGGIGQGSGGSSTGEFDDVQGTFDGNFEGTFDGGSEGCYSGGWIGAFNGVFDEIVDTFEGTISGLFEGTFDDGVTTEDVSLDGEFDGELDGEPTGTGGIRTGLFNISRFDTIQSAFIIPEF